MRIEETSIEGVVIVYPKVHKDARGYFFENYREDVYRQFGLPTKFVQDNQAFSHKNSLRGLHYQLKHPQGKLVRVTQGAVYDVAVDIRKGSPTYKQYIGATLSDENHKMMYIPEGFAHGYLVLSETAIFQYKCTDIFHPEDEYGLKWNDSAIGIDWEIAEPVLSEKDSNLPLLKDLNQRHLPIYGDL
ncbi:MAG: dTDP-4-dehydrorhamnose 3,5-epimerase [Candidatus Marinimicrobia bacterium]|nr:dTDP-4-dehydrorhamnose 3,5-epimerase [Candidatus Neomarinimicrobiota bacterium]MBL7059547.1 dTDP-4-dehydrorhamnose 3,5-epimerase [Candidatus Neomarinimicrobiota bacterium]